LQLSRDEKFGSATGRKIVGMIVPKSSRMSQRGFRRQNVECPVIHSKIPRWSME
jgi:hypothetical protein